MIAPRSLRTMIRCTPVWGPDPFLYFVNGAPDGWSMRKEIRVGFAAARPAGAKPASRYVRAAPIVICGGEDEEPQPASATASSTAIAAGFTRPIEASSPPQPPD